MASRICLCLLERPPDISQPPRYTFIQGRQLLPVHDYITAKVAWKRLFAKSLKKERRREEEKCM